MSVQPIPQKDIDKFTKLLFEDDIGHLLKRAIIKVSDKHSHEELDSAKQYEKYAEELENNYSKRVPKSIIKALRKIAMEEHSHARFFTQLKYMDIK